jgi:hypothetical protein
MKAVATFDVPEVLIGEISVRFEYSRFAPTCADAQVFFRLDFTFAPSALLV